MGKSIKYKLNENIFNDQNKLSCYWAGFLAADGYIGGYGNKNKTVKYLSFGLKEEDKYQVEKFKDFLECDKELIKNVKGDFISYQLNITNENICSKLTSNFNIVNNKSLILNPPNIQDDYLKDCFILGYIDGDGSIFSHFKKEKKWQPILTISIIGTLDFLNFIKNRFEIILNRSLGNIIFRKRKNNKNTFVLSVCAKTARQLYLHYYSLEVPKLKRKWTNEKYEYCKNWKRTSSRKKLNE